MRDLLSLLAGALLMAGLAATPAAAAGTGGFAFGFTSIEGQPLPLAQWQGRPVLVVNTASFCGYTRQYEGLQALWERYRQRGLVVLGVPSNDFGGQEPGGNAEIKTFCEVNFAVDFPMTEKVHVRGAGSHPLFAWLRQELGQAVGPGWNFHKFLIGPDGEAVAHWPSAVEPGSVEIGSAIEPLLTRPAT
jgi:glutathione peroxidase